MKQKPAPRMLICAATGQQFPYTGKGRPPKYAPGVAKPKPKLRPRLTDKPAPVATA